MNASPQPGSEPRVSVVVATRDRGALLRRAIDSVRRQTVGDWELIVVDDASRDATPAVAEDYARRDPRIAVQTMRERVGAAVARNRGAAVARARLLAFLDDDAVWEPEKLARQLAWFDTASADTGLVYCPFVYVDARGRERLMGADGGAAGDARRTLLRGNVIDTSTVLVRRDLFASIGGFDEQLPRFQDWDLCLRFAERSLFGFVPEPLVRCHFTAGSISSQTDALVVACGRLADKFAGRPAAETATGWYALGHALMIGGAPSEGRRMLLRALRLRPWPPQRWLMASLAWLGNVPYALASTLHEAVGSTRTRGRTVRGGSG